MACDNSFYLFGAGNLGCWLANKFQSKILGFIDETGVLPRTVNNLPVLHPNDKTIDRSKIVYVSILQPKHSFAQTKVRLNKQYEIESRSINKLFLYPELKSSEYLFLTGNPTNIPSGSYADLFENDDISLSVLEYFENIQSNKIEFGDIFFERKSLGFLRAFLLDADLVVDAGAYDGDTLIEIMDMATSPKTHFFGLEPDLNNFEKLKTRMASFGDRVTCLPNALWIKEEMLSFKSEGNMSSQIAESGSVQVKALDLAAFPLTQKSFVKMDLEGVDYDVFHAHLDFLKKKRPAFSASVYHRPTDLFAFLEDSRSLMPYYRFFLRPHGYDGLDLTLYGLPR